MVPHLTLKIRNRCQYSNRCMRICSNATYKKGDTYYVEMGESCFICAGSKLLFSKFHCLGAYAQKGCHSMMRLSSWGTNKRRRTPRKTFDMGTLSCFVCFGSKKVLFLILFLFGYVLFCYHTT